LRETSSRLIFLSALRKTLKTIILLVSAVFIFRIAGTGFVAAERNASTAVVSLLPVGYSRELRHVSFCQLADHMTIWKTFRLLFSAASVPGYMVDNSSNKKLTRAWYA